MDCATSENDVFEFEEDDVETVIVEASTVSGCQQSLPDLVPALLPEWNEELGLSSETAITEDIASTIDPVDSNETTEETVTNEGVSRSSLFEECLRQRLPNESFTDCIRRRLIESLTSG